MAKSLRKLNPVVIDNFSEGIAPSPNLGFGDMKNIDTFSVPGTATQTFRTDKASSSIVTDLPKWIVQNPSTGHIYALGDTGILYKSTDDGASWSALSGHSTISNDGDGLGIWKGYLIVCRNESLDLFNLTTETWTLNFQTLTSTGTGINTAFHPILHGQDDICYIGNERYVATLREVANATFDPTDAGSYRWNPRALDLPSGKKVKCLAELGVNLMIGTWEGANIYDIRTADIYPWDRTSDTFNLPIKLAEFGVHALLNIDNVLYIVAGLEASVYISNGSTTTLIGKPPRPITGISGGGYSVIYPGAVMHHHNRFHFGFSTGSIGSSYSGFGVWSVDKNGKFIFENQISTNTIIGTNPVAIGSLFSVNVDTYLIGWQDATAYGIDTTNQSTRYSSYKAYIDTALYQVGTQTQKRTFSQMDILFDRALSADQGIRIKYRRSLTDSFTTLAEILYDTYGAISSVNINAGIADCHTIQYRIEFTGNLPTYLRSITHH